jgi:hypothetical protein
MPLAGNQNPRATRRKSLKINPVGRVKRTPLDGSKTAAGHGEQKDAGRRIINRRPKADINLPLGWKDSAPVSVSQAPGRPFFNLSVWRPPPSGFMLRAAQRLEAKQWRTRS